MLQGDLDRLLGFVHLPSNPFGRDACDHYASRRDEANTPPVEDLLHECISTPSSDSALLHHSRAVFLFSFSVSPKQQRSPMKKRSSMKNNLVPIGFEGPRTSPTIGANTLRPVADLHTTHNGVMRRCKTAVLGPNVGPKTSHFLYHFREKALHWYNYGARTLRFCSLKLSGGAGSEEARHIKTARDHTEPPSMGRN